MDFSLNHGLLKYFCFFAAALSSDDPNVLQTEFRADLVNQHRRSTKKDLEGLVSVRFSILLVLAP